MYIPYLHILTHNGLLCTDKCCVSFELGTPLIDYITYQQVRDQRLHKGAGVKKWIGNYMLDNNFGYIS